MGKKDRRAEVPDKKARKAAASAKEEAKEIKEVPKIKGCHVSIDVCGGCIRPKDPVPESNSQDGVKMACSNHNCPFAMSHSVHKDCFQKLTDKVVSMLLRTGSSSWTDEQRVENAWRKKGLTFVGKYITCPCGHGTQTLEDSENRWSRVGEVVLDPHAYEKHREEKIKKALKQEKHAPTQPKSLNCSFGGRDQVVLERKLARMEFEKEEKFSRGDGHHISFPPATAAPKRKQQKQPNVSCIVPPPMDDEGFTPVGKDGRARELTPISSTSISTASSATPDSTGPQPLRSIVFPPTANLSATLIGNRADRGRTVSSCSNTSWLTSSTLPPAATKERKKGGIRETTRGIRNKENLNGTRKKPNAFSMLSGSEDEEEEEERSESPSIQSTMKGLREFADEFHSYSCIDMWTQSEVKELNQHLALFKSDSAFFQCRVTGRKLREPTLLTQLTPVTAWIFTTQAMALKKADIPPGTQLTLQEYYAIFHNHEVKHLTDPIVWCRDGSMAILECVDMTMLTM
ncbi:hypothetical protein PMAYCL1PPCAC_00092 [Pristionchus mayeri]|uniref:Headcase N-terminal domain-containing protein n=1 Tax=Pristionchus mayeri TaxID=1317129 RepID=A0AAN5C4M4_9BILA|nr:hypothetical protein PMAYCL1PPCAC_00092 [Pristionchus mayeri]